MIPLYSEKEFELAINTDLLLCKCIYCGNNFYKQKRVIKRTFNNYDGNVGNFCSRRCNNLSLNKNKYVVCVCCNKKTKKTDSEINKSKSGNHFCLKTCAVTYNNTHKTKGNRRSKLENYLETELIKIYPDLEIIFNNKLIINSELDIYIPLLKLAFELNGIFHYEPIFGDDKLNQIQNNDNRKFQACLEQGIELCIIDTSQQNYFKELTSKKYLDVIINKINIRL